MITAPRVGTNPSPLSPMSKYDWLFMLRCFGGGIAVACAVGLYAGYITPIWLAPLALGFSIRALVGAMKAK